MQKVDCDARRGKKIQVSLVYHIISTKNPPSVSIVNFFINIQNNEQEVVK